MGQSSNSGPFHDKFLLSSHGQKEGNGYCYIFDTNTVTVRGKINVWEVKADTRKWVFSDIYDN